MLSRLHVLYVTFVKGPPSCLRQPFLGTIRKFRRFLSKIRLNLRVVSHRLSG